MQGSISSPWIGQAEKTARNSKPEFSLDRGVSEGHALSVRWVGRMSGIRVYMEGFRVLPYGESNDDWLGLNADYTRRERTLRYLDNIGLESDSTDADEGLVRPSYNQFFGAVFLTHKKRREPTNARQSRGIYSRSQL